MKQHSTCLQIHRTIRLLVSVFIAAHLTGCIALIHNAVVSSYPTFEQTQKSWPSLAKGTGRVVIYWPRLAAGGFSPLGPGGMGHVEVTLDGQKSQSFLLMDQTFVFTHLAAGKHTVTVTKGFLFGPVDTTFEVLEGETTYLAIQASNQMSLKPTRIVEPTEAAKALADIRHSFEKPLPIAEQPKGAKRAL